MWAAGIGLSYEQQAAAVVFGGDRSRLDRVLGRLLAQQPITVGVVGGSISAGSTYSVYRGGYAAKLWHGLFFEWLRAAHPHRAHEHNNGALPASTPAFVESCVQFQVPPHSDLVLIDFAVNFDTTRAYERLLRRLLVYPRRPAVIAFNFPSFMVPGATKSLPRHPLREADLRFPAVRREELSIERLARHYGVPLISMSRAVGAVVRSNATAGLRLPDLMLDRVHPSQRGHRLAAALLVRFVQAELVRLRAAARGGRAPPPPSPAPPSPLRLPSPLVPGNDREDGQRYTCLRGEQLSAHVLSARGWQFTRGEGGNPKPGWAASAAGQTLEICWKPPHGWSRAGLKLGYLQAGWGRGRVRGWGRGRGWVCG